MSRSMQVTRATVEVAGSCNFHISSGSDYVELDHKFVYVVRAPGACAPSVRFCERCLAELRKQATRLPR